MSDTFNNYVQWAWKRKSELTKIIFERTNGEVIQGPFKGMKILPKWAWGDGDTAGKLLGLYECELFEYVNDAVSKTPDVVINVGCAEGFYGIGLGKITDSQVVLVDVSKDLINIARENARVNGVNKIQFTNQSSIETLNSYLNRYKKPFIFMDCEGFEEELLIPEFMPGLVNASLIVETHDCFRPNITARIVERFLPTHNIVYIQQGSKNPYIDIIADLSDYDKVLLCCEGRPQTSSWVYMVPKNAV
jgi:hypothetical protein